MTNKKWLLLYLLTIILIIGCVIAYELWLQPDNSALIDKVNDANEVIIVKPVESEPSSPKDKEEVMFFYANLVDTIKENDADLFNDMLLNGELHSLLFDATSGLCSGYAVTPNDVTSKIYIKDGTLFTESQVTDPPEYEIGLGLTDLEDSDPIYREAITKEGLLSRIDWSNIDYDYLSYHSADIYYHLLWTIDIAGDNAPHDWSIYKIADDTYVISNILGWYDSESECRVMVGKALIIKRTADNYKIAAMIDIV